MRTIADYEDENKMLLAENKRLTGLNTIYFNALDQILNHKDSEDLNVKFAKGLEAIGRAEYHQ